MEGGALASLAAAAAPPSHPPHNTTLNTTQPPLLNASEHGLGGCSWDYSIAPDVAFAAGHPWLGHWPNGGYEPSSNPWLRDDFRWAGAAMGRCAAPLPARSFCIDRPPPPPNQSAACKSPPNHPPPITPPPTTPPPQIGASRFRREFYSTLVRWAQAGGGPQYQIDGIYTWCA